MDSSPRTGVLETSAIGAATVAPGVDPRLAFELRRWTAAEPGQASDGYTLAWLVACHVRATGRDHLDEPLVGALAEISRRHRGHDHFLDAYLDCVLARHHGDLDSRSYLASPLLELIMADRRSGITPERLTVLLVADVIRYEAQPESVAALDAKTRQNRELHAARFIAEAEPALGSGAPTPPGTAAGEWMALTVLPVSPAHDEYLLIRALQAQELLFGQLTDLITSATAAARAGDLLGAAATVRRAHAVFQRAGTLVRVMSTMRGADVEALSSHVEGTTALRSQAHQRFERACGSASGGSASAAGGGLAGAAGGGLVGVAGGGLVGVADGGLAGAVADYRAAVTSPELAELMDAMAALEAAHQAWKSLHHGPAAAIVGGAPDAAAVLHVQRCMDERLFGSDAVGEVFGG